jgi:uracil-DNA glycosylase
VAAYLAAPAPDLRVPLKPQQPKITSKPPCPSLSPEATTFTALREAMMTCGRCPKLLESRTRVVPGDGAVPAEVAFIGLAPGRLGGDRTGIPFNGDRSGELLRRMIAESRLRGVFITNVVRCNPRDDRGRNRDPDEAEISNCRGHLMAELELVRPRLAVCLGKIAWNALAGRQYRFEPKGGIIVEIEGMRLLPMYHPAYVIRGAYAERSYRRDFKQLAKMLRGIVTGEVSSDSDQCN